MSPPPPAVEPLGYGDLNRYTKIIVDEARRRGIDVVVVDPDTGHLRLRLGDHVVETRESLSELTSPAAFERCHDKLLTRELLAAHDIPIPRGRAASFDADDDAFLATCTSVVVKPAVGEGGAAVTVGVAGTEELHQALALAAEVHPTVVIEEESAGDDVRVVVIAGEVVAAAVRRPPTVVGDGTSTVAALIEELDVRRKAETDGAAAIPLDETTEAVVRAAGWQFDDVLPVGNALRVRRTANVHTGGTITDVTDELHPDLALVAVDVARVLEIPVVGVDLMVPQLTGPIGVVIEANEQPGLANHEPRPTAERFLDLLFPETAGL